MNNSNLVELMQIFPQAGELVWIGVRPARGEPMITVNEVMVDQRSGLIGDLVITAAAASGRSL